MNKRINVNAENSKLIGDRLFITAEKMVKLGEDLQEFVVMGNNIKHPSLGMMYEYKGTYSRKA